MIYADDAINVINQYRTEEIVLTTMTREDIGRKLVKSLKLIFRYME